MDKIEELKIYLQQVLSLDENDMKAPRQIEFGTLKKYDRVYAASSHVKPANRVWFFYLRDIIKQKVEDIFRNFLSYEFLIDKRQNSAMYRQYIYQISKLFSKEVTYVNFNYNNAYPQLKLCQNFEYEWFFNFFYYLTLDRVQIPWMLYLECENKSFFYYLLYFFLHPLQREIVFSPSCNIMSVLPSLSCYFFMPFKDLYCVNITKNTYLQILYSEVTYFSFNLYYNEFLYNGFVRSSTDSKMFLMKNVFTSKGELTNSPVIFTTTDNFNLNFFDIDFVYHNNIDKAYFLDNSKIGTDFIVITLTSIINFDIFKTECSVKVLGTMYLNNVRFTESKRSPSLQLNHDVVCIKKQSIVEVKIGFCVHFEHFTLPRKALFLRYNLIMAGLRINFIDYNHGLVSLYNTSDFDIFTDSIFKFLKPAYLKDRTSIIKWCNPFTVSFSN